MPSWLQETAQPVEHGVDECSIQTIKRRKTQEEHPATLEEPWRKNLRGNTELVSGRDGERPDWWWTGAAPVQGTPGVLADGSITSLPVPNLGTCTRQEVVLTEVLFSALQGEEAFYRPPYHALRHPFIFYYSHVAVFYVNKLRVAGIIPSGINAHLEEISEVGVDEMQWDDMSKNEMDWPSVREVVEYRRQVYQLVKEVILTHPYFDHLPITWSKPAWAILMGIEHEGIHLETSSVLMRELPATLVRRPPQWPAYHPSVAEGGRAAPDNPLVAVGAGSVTLGKPLDWPTFGWDNEYGMRAFDVQPFKASKFLVCNGEFLEFVKAGGYRQQEWWGEQGWRWRTYRNAKWPTFWVQAGPQGSHLYQLRLTFEVVDMPWALPAVVNHHEAQAYCAWLSHTHGLQGIAAYRLLTEPEHHRMRRVGECDAEGRPAEDPVMSRSGEAFRGMASLNLAYGAECAVDAMPATPAGFHDVFGNVWQWCEDFFAALPGSRGVHPYYDDFSRHVLFVVHGDTSVPHSCLTAKASRLPPIPCYDGEHNIILGGSFISTGDEASIFARFHFRPHFFQHAGFRIVTSDSPKQTSCMDSPGPHRGAWDPSTKRSRAAEDQAAQEALQQQLLLHYGSAADALAGTACLPAELVCSYPQRLAKLLTMAAGRLGVPMETALEVGCSVGGVTLELARSFERVTGIDLDARAIAAALAAAAEGSVRFLRKDEGEVQTDLTLAVGVHAAARANASFKQMDPCCLAADMGPYDAVLVSECLERMPSPKALLGRLSGNRGLLRRGGLLLVTSTYAWSSEVADKQLWLGGIRDAAGSVVRGKEALAQALGPHFELVQEAELPYVLRQGERRYQLQAVHATLWRRLG
ncbi:hypothetical protein N2152v2_005190 [Parachlorella kessleri]